MTEGSKTWRFKSGQKALVPEGKYVEGDWIAVIMYFIGGKVLKETFQTDNVVLNLSAGIRWMKKNWNSDCTDITFRRINKNTKDAYQESVHKLE